MNEIYFLVQVIFVLLFSFGALRLGKSALAAAVALLAILANFFVLKQVHIFGFDVTCSDAYTIGSILSLNLLREYFGKEEAKKAITTCFFYMVFFVVMSQLHLKFAPSPHDSAQSAYSLLLTPAPRLLFASLSVFYIVQHLDLRLFSWISSILPRSNFSLRSTLSMSISQLIDTLLFGFLGLYGLVANMFHIILISYLLKMAIISVLSPLTLFAKRLERRV